MYAPQFTVPEREFVAVEHPMVVKNIDNGLKTFGRSQRFKEVLTSEARDASLPLYLRPADPTCAPILSQNANTSNVVLMITVPKRTGRKRKRGSKEPYAFESPEDEAQAQEEVHSTTLIQRSLSSHSRLDQPKRLRRILKDNVGVYEVEAVGNIYQTHRFRAMADFHSSTYHGPFMTNFREHLLPGKVADMRNFKFNPSRGVKPNDEIIPPPIFSDKSIPVNWAYSQNPNIKIEIDPNTGEQFIKNQARRIKIFTHYIAHDEPAPTKPLYPPPDDPALQSLIKTLLQAMEIRPIWTRRSLNNYVGNAPGLYLLRPAIQYIGYQFRGGPWRDAVIKFGVDPRTDPKYRIYQTFFFKIYTDQKERMPGTPWVDGRSEYSRKLLAAEGNQNSHIFDGTSVSMDGKVWQICDITDTLLRTLIDTNNFREDCDIETDGWYLNGTIGKIKAVMRTKIAAIRMGREVTDKEFEKTLATPDHVPGKKVVVVPVPDLNVDENGPTDSASLKPQGIRKRKKKGLLNEKRNFHKSMPRNAAKSARKMSEEGSVATTAMDDVIDPRVSEAMEGLGILESENPTPGPEELKMEEYDTATREREDEDDPNTFNSDTDSNSRSENDAEEDADEDDGVDDEDNDDVEVDEEGEEDEEQVIVSGEDSEGASAEDGDVDMADEEDAYDTGDGI